MTLSSFVGKRAWYDKASRLSVHESRVGEKMEAAVMERWRQYRHRDVYSTTSKKGIRRKQRRWRPTRRQMRFVTFVGGGLLLTWLLFRSPVLAIHDVTLAGETTDALQKMTGTWIGRNLITLSEKRVYRDFLAGEPSLAALRLTRGFPHQLQIHFERRHPAIVWLVGETRWAVDEGGIVFGYDEATGQGRPTVIDRRAQPVTAGQKIVTPDFVKFIVAAGEQVPVVVQGRLLYGEIDETTVHLRLMTEWGWSILLDTTRPLNGQLANLALVLADQRDQIHEYVDLRLAGWAYLK